MKKKILLFILFCLPSFAHSQQWQAYSDSIGKITSVKHDKKDLEKANRFIELADRDIEKRNIVKDTIFAHYLYLKGVVKYKIGQFTSQPFEESISIWNKSPKKNYLKLSKVHYFLADGFNLIKNYSKAYVNYEKCYLINKQFNLKSNIYFSNSIYCLSYIDFNENFNLFGQYEFPVIQNILYFIDNEVHHRGQGYVYLRALGIEPPFFWER